MKALIKSGLIFLGLLLGTTTSVDIQPSNDSFCTKDFDLAFAIDTTTGNQTDESNGECGTELAIVSNIISLLNVSVGRTHTGCVTFGSDSRIIYDLNSVYYYDLEGLQQTVSSITCQGDERNTASGLRTVAKEFFIGQNGDRKQFENVLLLFVKERANVETALTISYADLLKSRRGVRIIVIAMKHENLMDEIEYQKIASSREDLVFADDIWSTTEQIIELLCKENIEQKSTDYTPTSRRKRELIGPPLGNVVGATGATGPRGLTGQPGFPGPVGAPGPFGLSGPTGATGIAGAPGMPGPAGGATGATGIVGAPGLPGSPGGATGASGLTGRPGQPGSSGPPGATGSSGIAGTPGRNGVAGSFGPTGATGPTGIVGAPGMPGSPGGATGATGPTGPPGQVSIVDKCLQNNGGCQHMCQNTPESYYCTCNQGFQLENPSFSCNGINFRRKRSAKANEQILARSKREINFHTDDYFCGYYPNVGGNSKICFCKINETLIVPMNGTQCVDVDECSYKNGGCDQGCVNTIGSYYCICEDGLEIASNRHSCIGTGGPAIREPGLNGATGATGPRGLTGVPGYPGMPGPEGAPGPFGRRGPTGATGLVGAPGMPGPAGGATGATGVAGAPGLPGSPGGATGASGPTGRTGQPGSSGYPGAMGIPGAPGRDGPTGSRGLTGATGPTGIVGAPGMPGSPGGATGATGPAGPPGQGVSIVNKCLQNNGGCQHMCQNTPESYYCSCNKGFQLENPSFNCNDSHTDNYFCGYYPDVGGTSKICFCKINSTTILPINGTDCVDVDECFNDNGGCDQGCVNTNGSYYCTCEVGLKIAPNKHACIDIDECKGKIPVCSTNSVCINSYGSYACSPKLSVSRPPTPKLGHSPR